MTARSSSGPRPRRCSPPARSTRGRTWRASTRCSRSGAPGLRRTAFLGVQQLPPGGLLVWERGRIVEQRRWWVPEYGVDGSANSDLRDLLGDSVRLRLRADVPVGAYLSGGLDSSLISALAQIEKARRAPHLLDRLQGSALRRARPPGGRRALARDPPPRGRGGPGGDRPSAPGRCSATPRRRWCGRRRCRSSCSPSRCAPTTSRW